MKFFTGGSLEKSNFNTRELAEKLKINFQKWKRWSREFLPPDVITSLPKGYAREYTLKEAFTVYLGGHLVGTLDFPIPEAKKIIDDLIPWINEKRLIPESAEIKLKKKGIDQYIKRYTITIYKKQKQYGFYYEIKGSIDTKPSEYEGYQVYTETFIEDIFDPDAKIGEKSTMHKAKAKVLEISHLAVIFQMLLK